MAEIDEARDVQKRNESYNAYVEQVTPKHSCVHMCAKAFVTGGAFCVLGQLISLICERAGADETMRASIVTIVLIAISAVLTGLGIYSKLAMWAGAGSLVPITGFANSVAAPAIEYKKEGNVFGIGCKIFTIAGPVILYGILFSWLAGLIYWLSQII